MNADVSAGLFCVGGAVQDFIFFVDEIPREPRKYRANEFLTVGGGCAATAAVAASRLGGNVLLSVRLGNDLTADLIVAELEEYGVDCTFVSRHEGLRSPISSIFVDQDGERLIMGFRDQRMPDATDSLPDSLPDGINVVLTDTRWAAGNLQVAHLARQANIPCVLDGESPFDECRDLIELSTHVVFSAPGLRDLSGTDDRRDGLKSVRAMTDAWLAVTDGSNGTFVLDGDAVVEVPAPPVQVVDTLGAGDVWHGAFALALGEGQGELAAVRFANAAASLKCGRKGGRMGSPERDEVLALMEEST